MERGEEGAVAVAQPAAVKSSRGSGGGKILKCSTCTSGAGSFTPHSGYKFTPQSASAGSSTGCRNSRAEVGILGRWGRGDSGGSTTCSGEVKHGGGGIKIGLPEAAAAYLVRLRLPDGHHTSDCM